MGVGISDWRLAGAVSRLGQLGVVSGTALDAVLTRTLQDGDPDGHMRRAFDRFPFPKMAERIWTKYFIPGGKSAGSPYRLLPMHIMQGNREVAEICILANFVEVFLAREGHDQPVGINYLEKVQMPHLPSIYGAMLAGVEYVLMGAGIPAKVPGVLDAFVRHEPATYPLHVAGALAEDETMMHFTPADFMECELAPLRRPKFLAIVSSHVLAATLLKKANGTVNGFIVEGPTAGGHNAPPRGKLQLNEAGEAVYGERDAVDLEKMRQLGAPFWLAGGFGSADQLRRALEQGAAGIQVGTAFAFCEESGLRSDYKRNLIEKVAHQEATVFTDPSSSPTGFPFKAAQLEGSASEPDVYSSRERVCDVGHLREAFRTADGKISYRCPAEPVHVYVAKGGDAAKTVGKKCLCNSLLANIGLPQVRKGVQEEPGLVTAGNDLTGISRFFKPGSQHYTAADVIRVLLS